jgi:hypothetical protein
MVDRLPAVPVAVRDLIEGRFEKREGAVASVVHTRFGDVSRVSVVGVLVDLFSESDALVDDGSGSVEIRSYGLPIRAVVGEPVLVIGMVRSGPWIAAEIVREIVPGWIRVRRDLLSSRKPSQEVSRPVSVVQETLVSPNEAVLRSIREMDHGEGVDVEDLAERVDVPDFDAVLDALLKEGEIYEVRGKVRVLK